jgi:hypothetical protein
MNITLDNGRTELWQWDTGRKIVVDDKSVSEVHYSKYSSTQAITREVINGKAEIPNYLLQDTHDVTVYAYSGSIENGYTAAEKTFSVAKKPKPANYVETKEDQAILAKLKEEIGDLSELQTEAKDNLVSAINEAAASGADKHENITNNYYVELDGVYPNYTLSSATPIQDIKTAYVNGKTLFCRCIIGSYTAVLPLFVPGPTNNLWLFSGSGGIHIGGLSFYSQYFTIAVTSNGVMAENEVIATKEYVDNKEVVVKSSTAGSTKKFKITVNDTGALSAVEVT